MSTSATTSETAAPPILSAAGALLGGYDVILCDVWGVVHNGRDAFTTACTALERFRRGGGTVVLLSNAPVPNDAVAAMLDWRRVPRSAYDVIVSSGDIALSHVVRHGYVRHHAVGPLDRDAALFRRLPGKPVALADADSIVCSGLADDETETAESYRPLLEVALARRLPFVCANPDLVVDVAGRLYICAGAIAAIYEEMGGSVFWAGKPHAPAYAAALARAADIRGIPTPLRRTLAIGDALRTDLRGAERAGIDAMFIGAGIHRHDCMTADELDPDKLARLFAPGSPRAIAAMPVLAW